MKAKFYKEPFFHFLLIGALVFILNGIFNSEDSSENEIVITNDDVARISKLYAQNWNRQPDPKTLENLIDNYINSEIYYAEALKLNLDHNDEIIKRRLKQKYEFVAEDLADVIEPSNQELREFYEAHLDQFYSDSKITFYQYYVNPDRNNDPISIANKLLKQLSRKDTGKLEKKGDVSHIGFYQSSKSEFEIAREFGSSFSQELMQISDEGWYGPLSSGFGYHIIYVEAIEPKGVLPFEAVIENVKSEWTSQNRSLFAERLISSLRNNYKIVRHDK